MTVHWASLLDVFLVSIGSTVAVVVLVAVALLQLPARGRGAVAKSHLRSHLGGTCVTGPVPNVVTVRTTPDEEDR